MMQIINTYKDYMTPWSAKLTWIKHTEESNKSNHNSRYKDMKKLLYIPAILLLAACSQPKQGKEAQKAELAKLKTEQADINAKITKLQTALGATDSVKS